MMVLYSGTTCPYSHRCRFVLFEKGMDFEIPSSRDNVIVFSIFIRL